MITLNSKITVFPSRELSDMRLSEMKGKQGRVIEDLTAPKRRNKGYMVHFPKSFLSEKDWFIPLESVRHDK